VQTCKPYVRSGYVIIAYHVRRADLYCELNQFHFIEVKHSHYAQHLNY